MPNKNQDKIKKLQNFDADPNLAMFDEIQEISEALGNFKNVEMLKIKGDKGDKGDTPKIKTIAKEATKMVRVPKDGKDGVSIKGDKGDSVKGDKGDSGDKGKDGKDGNIKELSLDEIRNSLELLQGDDRLDKSAIKGIEELQKELRDEINAVRSMKSSSAFGGLVNTVRFVDLTAQCDGSNKTFQVPLHRKVVMLSGTQFPLIYRPVTDYTTANHTLKLTSEVGAPETNQTLIFQYIK